MRRAEKWQTKKCPESFRRRAMAKANKRSCHRFFRSAMFPVTEPIPNTCLPQDCPFFGITAENIVPCGRRSVNPAEDDCAALRLYSLSGLLRIVGRVQRRTGQKKKALADPRLLMMTGDEKVFSRLPVQIVSGPLRRRADQADEQRMRFIGAAFEFGMELNADKERLAGKLHGLHQPSVRGQAG